ncbi:MAG TPA: methyltransferase domain-containing protein [Oligoflexia bacterium]|nr:methyltransferase domain-containing protein [Oligoflexia bacterium]HMP47049.1 methyltransferase domain-containing protein [Oligoflexia bacterium]
MKVFQGYPNEEPFQEVIDGVLISENREFTYPIINGVPRMLPPHLIKHLVNDYPEFFDKYSAQLNELQVNSSSQDDQTQRHTQEAFGYEWTWAADYDANNFSDWLPTGFTQSDLFKDKLGLEVGCGAGRHAENTSTLARTHFAVDLSRAVDSAFERNRFSLNCHVIQADAFYLPFREETFEYVYCLGVLQHMHDPPNGFKMLSKFPKKSGILLVNVYQAGRPFTVGTLSLIRKITTRLPNETLRLLSVIAGYIEYYVFILPWKLLKRTFLSKVLRPIVPNRVDEYSRHSLKTIIVDWFDRLSCPVKIHYSKENLEGWYKMHGYESIKVTPYWKAFWNGYGVRK